MIDFEECKIRSLCHPARGHGSDLSSRLSDEITKVADEQAVEVDEYIENREYDRASDLLGEMIERLEELEDSVRSDSEIAHQLIYDEVENKSYHGRIVTASSEYDEEPCTLGALKAAKQDLDSHPI